MNSSHGIALFVFAVVLLTSACSGKKEEAFSATQVVAASSVGVVCSYAPSQNNLVSHLSAVGGGSSVAAASVAHAAGLTAVLHSSGAYIFTGASGYVAGTIGSAAALPAIVTIGIVVGGSVATLELVCASRNHPDLVSKVETAAVDFLDRSKRSVASASKRTAAATGPVIAQAESVVVKTSNDAFEYASRASVLLSQAIQAKLK